MNNKKHLAGILLMVLFICFSVSCGKQQAPSEDIHHTDIDLGSYVFETDWQYYMSANGNTSPKIRETENGCVFVNNGFIYYYEQGGSIMPLCSNVNCLHDQETDPEKKKECLAYLDDIREGDVGTVLMKYKDDLFVRYERTDHDAEKGDFCVMKMALDGSSKDMVCRVKDMNYPLIHRGYLYYYSTEFSVTEEESQSDSMSDGIMEQVGFHRMDIEKRNPKAELVYYREGDHGFAQPQVYGNYMWLFVIGDQGQRRETRIYNIETNQMEEAETVMMPVQIYQGKAYVRLYDGTKSDLDKTTVVQMDLYGKTEKTVVEGIEQLCDIMSDEKYFYISNSQLHQNHPEILEKIQVYDANFQLVDEYRMPDVGNLYGSVPIGGEKYQYLRYINEKEGEWGLLVFNKNRIGSLKGGACPYTIIKYGAEGSSSGEEPESYEPESYDPETDISEPIEIKVPETILYTETSVSYTEPEDQEVTGKLKRKRYLDAISENYTECQVYLSADKVKVVVTPLEIEDVFGNDILLGRCNTRRTTLYGYYTKGKETYVRKMTMTAIKTTEPDTAELRLPEDGDEFIGVKAVTEAEYLIETWTPPEKGLEWVLIKKPEAFPPSVGSFKEFLECYDGKVEE